MLTHTPPSPAHPPAFAPDLWLFQVFSPLAVASGAALRRPMAEVEAQIGRTRFLSEAAARGYRVSESGRDFLLTLDRAVIPVLL